MVVLLGALAALAVPRTRAAVTRARATAISEDMRTARLALIEYRLESNAWPATSEPGRVPPELAPFLPDGFSFESRFARLAYVNLAADGDGRWGSEVGLLVHVEDDPALQRALTSILAQMSPESEGQQVMLGVQTDGGES